MGTKIKWHYISEEGMPKLKNNLPKTFLVCVRYALMNGNFVDVCTVAIIQKKETTNGRAYTPAMKFYYGPDIFDNAYAWAELPEAVEFKN